MEPCLDACQNSTDETCASLRRQRTRLALQAGSALRTQRAKLSKSQMARMRRKAALMKELLCLLVTGPPGLERCDETLPNISTTEPPRTGRASLTSVAGEAVSLTKSISIVAGPCFEELFIPKRMQIREPLSCKDILPPAGHGGMLLRKRVRFSKMISVRVVPAVYQALRLLPFERCDHCSCMLDRRDITSVSLRATALWCLDCLYEPSMTHRVNKDVFGRTRDHVGQKSCYAHNWLEMGTFWAIVKFVQAARPCLPPEPWTPMGRTCSEALVPIVMR